MQQHPFIAYLISLFHTLISDVAMVLIITMICKIYFPGALERSTPDSLPDTRTYNYRRVGNEKRERSSSYYSSDEEDTEEKEQQSLLNDCDINSGGNTRAPSKKLQVINDSTNKALPNRTSLEFYQSSSSKKDVISRLIFCVIMLNVTFVTWGALQEVCRTWLQRCKSQTIVHHDIRLS